MVLISFLVRLGGLDITWAQKVFPTPTMAPKRKFEGEKLPIEDLHAGLSSLISNYELAESAAH